MTKPRLATLFAALVLSALPIAVEAQDRHNEQLIRSVEREMPRFLPNVDVRSLSPHQIASLHLLFYSSLSQSEIRTRAQSIVGGLDVLVFGRNLTFR